MGCLVSESRKGCEKWCPVYTSFMTDLREQRLREVPREEPIPILYPQHLLLGITKELRSMADPPTGSCPNSIALF